MARKVHVEAKPLHIAGQLFFTPLKRDALKVLLGWSWVFTYRHEWPDATEVGKSEPELSRGLREMAPPWWDAVTALWRRGS